METLIKTRMLGLILSGMHLLLPLRAHAKWRWTPETGWYNTKEIFFANPEEQFKHGVRLFEQGQYQAARQQFVRVSESMEGTALGFQAGMYHARCLRRLHYFHDAYEIVETLYNTYPDADIEEMAKLEFEIGMDLLNGGRIRFWGMPLFSGLGTSEEIFDSVIRHYPFGPFSDDALFSLGKAQYKRKQYLEAELTYARLVRDYPESEWAGAADFMTGMCIGVESLDAMYDQEQTMEAIKQFEHYLLNFPEGADAEEANHILSTLHDRLARKDYAVARYYHMRNQHEAVRLFCRAALRHAPDSKWGEQAQELLASLED